jgi:hypothetical protein
VLLGKDYAGNKDTLVPSLTVDIRTPLCRFLQELQGDPADALAANTQNRQEIASFQRSTSLGNLTPGRR